MYVVQLSLSLRGGVSVALEEIWRIRIRVNGSGTNFPGLYQSQPTIFLASGLFQSGSWGAHSANGFPQTHSFTSLWIVIKIHHVLNSLLPASWRAWSVYFLDSIYTRFPLAQHELGIVHRSTVDTSLFALTPLTAPFRIRYQR